MVRSLLVICFFVLSLPASAAITLVNVTSGFDDSSTSDTVMAAAAANHTTGNLLYVCVRGGNQAATHTVTDTAGNTFTSIATMVNTNSIGRQTIFYAKNITGNSSNIVTAHFSGVEDFRHIHVLQYSGLDTVNPLDTFNNTGKAASGGTLTSGTFTTTAASEVLVFSGDKAASGTTYTQGTGYTAEVTTDGTMMTQDKIVSAIQTSVTSAMTDTDTAAAWTIIGATFKAPAVGGGGLHKRAKLRKLGLG